MNKLIFKKNIAFWACDQRTKIMQFKYQQNILGMFRTDKSLSGLVTF